jgi:response regulator of citrate/malate metabolism
MTYKPFTPERFEQLVKEFQEQEALIMSHKGDEYAANEDRLLNFRQVAEFEGRTPAKVALTWLLKHIQSITLAVQSAEYAWAWETEGGEGLKQRIADARNYLLLLAACLEEEHQAKERVRFDRAFATYYETQGLSAEEEVE